MLPIMEAGKTDYVLTGLVKRRAAIAGEIEAAHENIRKLIGDLEALDATIQQFDPTSSMSTKVTRRRKTGG